MRGADLRRRHLRLPQPAADHRPQGRAAVLSAAPPDAGRPFGFWTATALIVGGMIGSGIFLLPPALAPFGWTGVVAWAVSIAGALSIAYALARLTAAMPGETGAVAITGAVLGPLVGVLVGWSYWVSVWAANAAISIAAASYVAVFAPALAATPLRGAAAAVALVWLMVALNLGGARVAGRFQVLTTALKLIPLGVILALALVPGAQAAALPPVPSADGLLAGLPAAIALTLFPLIGFEAAGVAAERVRDPARTVFRATMTGTAVTGLLYILVCSAIVLMLPADRVAASATPFQLFVETFWGRGPALAVSAFAAIAAVGALNGWVLVSGEVPLGMARAGLLPPWFARVDRRDVPAGVLILSAVLASALVLANSSKSMTGVFAFAALLTTCANLWLYLAICAAALRRRIAAMPAAVGLAFCLVGFWGAGAAASGLSLVLMLAALPAYALRPRAAAPAPAAE